MMDVQHLTVVPDEGEMRLDRWFRRRFPGLGHGQLEKLLRTGQIRVDGARAKAATRLAAGQVVRVPPLPEDRTTGEPAVSSARKVRLPTQKEIAQLQARVLYRDADVLVIDKPSGLAVQGGTGTTQHLDAMLDALRFDAVERPRLVHRLDRDTSGVLVLARTSPAARHLAAAFRDRDTLKVYWAVTVGVPKPRQGRIDLPLTKMQGPRGGRMAADEADGRSALTDYSVIEDVHRRAAWVALWPRTGRTHQLRVHMAAIGTPILGDRTYGGEAAELQGSELDGRRIHLHARMIRLPKPGGGRIEVTAPLPPHMAATWSYFGFAPDTDENPFGSLL